MSDTLRDSLHRSIDAAPEPQLALLVRFMSTLPTSPAATASTEALFAHAGAWGETLGAEIAAIVERDCESIPEA